MYILDEIAQKRKGNVSSTDISLALESSYAPIKILTPQPILTLPAPAEEEPVRLKPGTLTAEQMAEEIANTGVVSPNSQPTLTVLEKPKQATDKGLMTPKNIAVASVVLVVILVGLYFTFKSKK